VGALAIYLEDEGIPTVQVSLVREHTEALRPPRALWVPFMLGRPLGVPDDPAFQKRVLIAALRLLEREAGPVLEDYPEEAPEPGAADEPEAVACPVSFAPNEAPGTPVDAVLGEIGGLRMWHELAVRRGHGSTGGVTGTAPEELARFIAAHAGGHAAPAYREGLPAADALRLACEDLKTFYLGARSAQPGAHTATGIRNWFWGETAAARLLFRLHAALENHRDPRIKDFARNSLLPRAARHAAGKPRGPDPREDVDPRTCADRGG
jgi:hypothetical protein